jgi:hypothetical protein
MVGRVCGLIGMLLILSGCSETSQGCHAKADAASSGAYRGGGISLLTCW